MAVITNFIYFYQFSNHFPDINKQQHG